MNAAELRNLITEAYSEANTAEYQQVLIAHDGVLLEVRHAGIDGYGDLVITAQTGVAAS